MAWDDKQALPFKRSGGKAVMCRVLSQKYEDVGLDIPDGAMEVRSKGTNAVAVVTNMLSTDTASEQDVTDGRGPHSTFRLRFSRKTQRVARRPRPRLSLASHIRALSEANPIEAK